MSKSASSLMPCMHEVSINTSQEMPEEALVHLLAGRKHVLFMCHAET